MEMETTDEDTAMDAERDRKRKPINARVSCRISSRCTPCKFYIHIRTPFTPQ